MYTIKENIVIITMLFNQYFFCSNGYFLIQVLSWFRARARYPSIHLKKSSAFYNVAILLCHLNHCYWRAHRLISTLMDLRLNGLLPHKMHYKWASFKLNSKQGFSKGLTSLKKKWVLNSWKHLLFWSRSMRGGVS